MFIIGVRPIFFCFLYWGFEFIIRARIENQFLAIFLLRYIRKFNFEIEQTNLIIKALNLLIGSASKSNFWQYFNCVIKGILIDFEIDQTSFYY